MKFTRPATLALVVLSFTVAVCGGLSITRHIQRMFNEGGPRARLRSLTTPNIIFVLTDDQDYDSLAAMPIVNTELVAKGMNFTRHYVTDSLCCPSRASILRSQFVHSHGVEGNSTPLGGFQKFVETGDEQCTIATWLKDTGYRRALMGKYLNEYPKSKGHTYVPPDWDEWASPIGVRAYTGFDYVLNHDGALETYGTQPHDYFTDMLSGRAQEFVQTALNDATPFFLYVASFTPHQPAVPAPRHKGMFPGAQEPRGGSFDQADVALSPNFIQRLVPLNQTEVRHIDDLYRRRLQSLQAVDEMVGALVKLLEDNGVIDNTYIIFTSDNGFHLGQHRLRPGKRTAYEEDIHVPLVIRGPGITPGTQSSALTSELDFGPTIAEWAGGTVPDFAEGRSLGRIFERNGEAPAHWRKVMLVEHFSDSDEPFEAGDASSFSDVRRGHHSNIPPYFALRTESQLYVHYADDELELYDTTSDPFELHNLASQTVQSKLDQLEAWLKEMGACSGATCRTAEEHVPVSSPSPSPSPTSTP
jgi:arylsulfatase A-like enzyme